MLCDSEAEEQSLIRAPLLFLMMPLQKTFMRVKVTTAKPSPTLRLSIPKGVVEHLGITAGMVADILIDPDVPMIAYDFSRNFKKEGKTKSSTKKRKRLRIRLSPEAIRRLRRARALLERKNRDDHALHAGGPCGSHL